MSQKAPDDPARTAGITPEQAVDRLEALHDDAVAGMRAVLERTIAGGAPPTPEERAAFRYPLLRLTYAPGSAEPPPARRAWAKFQGGGIYATTITQPRFFRSYLLEQLRPLVEEFGAVVEVGPSAQEMPYPYVLERGAEFDTDGGTAAMLARHFPVPALAAVGDEAADSLWQSQPGEPLPLGLFDAVRVDYSLRRLVHYTGTDWRSIQPWILLTNYHRYVDQFLRWATEEMARPESPWRALVLPGGIEIGHGDLGQAKAKLASTPWHKFQMPAYHLLRADGGGVTLVNIGVGPSNAKNITDHLAVLRPNCWLMVGHCAGLRQSQRIGDYVLAGGEVAASAHGAGPPRPRQAALRHRDRSGAPDDERDPHEQAPPSAGEDRS